MKYFIITCLIFIVGCSGANKSIIETKVANPALKKCIQDGYTVSEMKQNGIIIRYICVNKELNKKCKVWEYYRGECKLK